MNEGTTLLEHLNFFNKVINELLAVDVKIDEEDKALILLSSLIRSYDHIITTMLCGKKTLILEEITSTLLSNEIRKMPSQEEKIGSGLVVTGRKEREGKKGLGFVKGVSLLSQGRSLENDYKHRQEWLEKKRQASEADLASSVDTEVLMTSYIKDNTSHGKSWIFDSDSMVHVYF